MPKLLIVDDECDVREFARNFFRKRKIEVITASGGRQALDLIVQEKPLLVLLDVKMEEMTGIEVLREIHHDNLGVKVIMVSGATEEQIINEAKSLGALDFINKPFVLEELEEIVLAHLKI